jgi:predicted MFS family arabinose efflux permease
MVQAYPTAPSPEGRPEAHPDRWWTLAAVECGNFVVSMDGFIVTLALPAMAREFGVGLPVLKWVIVAYLLTVTVTLLRLDAQLVLGRSPVMADVLFVPLSLVLRATSLTVSSLGERAGARTLSTAAIIGPLVLLGMGGGLFHPPNNSATLNPVPPQHLSVANGFLSMARNFGQAIGAALAATLLASGLGAAGADAALALVGAAVSAARGPELPAIR